MVAYQDGHRLRGRPPPGPHARPSRRTPRRPRSPSTTRNSDGTSQLQPGLLRRRRRLDRPHPDRHDRHLRDRDQGREPAAGEDARARHAGRLRQRHPGRPGPGPHARRNGLDRLRHRDQRQRRLLGRPAAVPAGRDRPRLDARAAGHRSRAGPGRSPRRFDGLRRRRPVRLLVAHRRRPLRRPDGGLPVPAGRGSCSGAGRSACWSRSSR